MGRAEVGTTFAFASAGWIDAFAEATAQEMIGLDTGGRTYRIAREFTNAPPDLCSPGTSSVGWCLEVRDGSVRVEHGPANHGDASTVADYDAMVAAARLVIGDDEQARAEATRIVETAISAGQFAQSGEADLPAEIRRRLSIVHDRVARVTN
jgi:hypothetical protein